MSVETIVILDPQGVPIGGAASPMRVDPTGSTAQPISLRTLLDFDLDRLRTMAEAAALAPQADPQERAGAGHPRASTGQRRAGTR